MDTSENRQLLGTFVDGDAKEDVFIEDGELVFVPHARPLHQIDLTPRRKRLPFRIIDCDFVRAGMILSSQDGERLLVTSPVFSASYQVIDITPRPDWQPILNAPWRQ